VIENCPGAVNIDRGAEFVRDTGKIDIFAVEMPLAITKRMHE
jgi:hypothetical protein